VVLGWSRLMAIGMKRYTHWGIFRDGIHKNILCPALGSLIQTQLNFFIILAKVKDLKMRLRTLE
jgi:hypothetical protein